MTAESEQTKKANGSAAKAGTGARTAAAKGRRATEAAGDHAKSGSAVAATKAKSSAQDAAASAESGVRSAGLATKRAAAAGWDTGRKTVLGTAGKVTSTATTAWTVVKHRKAIAVGAAAGLGGLVGGAFALGRQTARTHAGPITRLTGGRI
ncbi:hypothetical protein PV394_09500 [Streptomyces sp. NE06-03E]|uniref:Uncharacterized protein n=2 Tax=Streptomyces TaxID=1883 RepID=A0A652KKE7_9ACTN|nr:MULTISPECIES: hypothetical protein [unclassified Streptomyces]WSS62017.1 hypothetical protein OG284_12615 [Streptomyces sp. NBC_01177]WSS76057.1 hypothetical protein OG414_12745 [Streptomyces sp. NBC_01174]MDX3055372.1 hypothetical protein [Streptomyces sp. NE06-03E]MDX3327742.1 hypothetical protein [Streptomyces sp. ME02-6979-3A]MDX3428884.1 hypothetical protein [Streptomyces sp. ME01-18a]